MANLCWKEEMLDINFHDEEEFDKIMKTVVELREPAKVLALVSTQKEGGNFFFNNEKFELANDKYIMSAKYLICTLLASMIDFVTCQELEVALLLNCAACAIKLGSFQRAVDLCSLVINIQPECTKAWFRRVKAVMEVGLITTSYQDLIKAQFGS